MAKYLYNGVEFPALPEVDGFENKFIVHAEGSVTKLYIATGTAYVQLANNIKASADLEYIVYDLTDGAWVSGGTETEVADGAICYYGAILLWANYDVLNADGTLYLAASDPIPVGTPITDPISYTMGYMWMMAMLANRAKRKPIGYLYNGVYIAGELPEYDEEAYPYCAIVYDYSTGNYCFGAETVAMISAGKVIGGILYNKYELVNGVWEARTSTIIGTVIWANHDIIYWSGDENAGEVALAASDPVPVYKGIVAYEYNGVRLPALPEWDKSVYPYAVIAEVGDGEYRLLCTTVQIDLVYDTGVFISTSMAATYTFISYDVIDGEWVQNNVGAFVPVIWTNYNLYYHETEDNAGELYLAASEPIPVYE